MKKMAFILFVIVFTAACSDKQQDNEVVVSYDGGVLTKQDLIAHYKILKRDPQYRKNPEQLMPEKVIEHAINMEMIIQAGLKRKIHQDPYVRQDLHKKMSDLFLKLLQNELVPQIDQALYTDEQIEEFYKRNTELYKKPALYNVSMIKIGNGDAKEVYRKIISNEIDFETAVHIYSVDEKSKQNSGSIGIRALNKFGPSWRSVVSNLKLGEVSKPIHIAGDSYIFLLVSKTEEQQQKLADIKSKVRNDILYNDYRQEWEKTYNSLRSEFNVEINDDIKQQFLREISKN